MAFCSSWKYDAYASINRQPNRKLLQGRYVAHQQTPDHFSRSAIPKFPVGPASPGCHLGALNNDVGSWRRSSKMTSATILPPTSPRYSPLCWTSASVSTYNHKGVSDQVAGVFSSLAVHGVRPRARAMASP